MLGDINIHYALLSESFFDEREEDFFLAFMVVVKDGVPGEGIADEVAVFRGGDVGRLKVDGVEMTDNAYNKHQ